MSSKTTITIIIKAAEVSHYDLGTKHHFGEGIRTRNFCGRTKSDVRTIWPKIVSIILFVLLSFINMFFSEQTPEDDTKRTTFLSRNSFQSDPLRVCFCQMCIGKPRPNIHVLTLFYSGSD